MKADVREGNKPNFRCENSCTKPLGDPMATKEQYEFFKSVYDEHRDRIKALESRAQLYFTIQSLYFGFVVLKLSDIYGA